MIKITGLDSLTKKLKQMQGDMKELGETNEIPLSQLMSNDFIAKQTSFISIDEMIEASGLVQDPSGEFLQSSDWDLFVTSNSRFTCWKDMQQSAAKLWVQKKLKL